jgi:hypothetical protein
LILTVSVTAPVQRDRELAGHRTLILIAPLLVVAVVATRCSGTKGTGTVVGGTVVGGTVVGVGANGVGTDVEVVVFGALTVADPLT